MEFLKSHWYLAAIPAVVGLLFLIRAVLSRRSTRQKQAEIAQLKRRDDALTDALRNPLVRDSGAGREGPIEIKWDDKAVNAGKGTSALMLELVELSAYSRRKYVYQADQSVIIGSGKDCRMMLPREGVADRHCEVFMKKGRPGVRSFRGAGTKLIRNGKAVVVSEGGVYLTAGDHLLIGSTEVEFNLYKG